MNDNAYTGPRDPINAPSNQPQPQQDPATAAKLPTDDRVKEWTHEKLQGLLQISNEDRHVTDDAFENTLDEINSDLKGSHADAGQEWTPEWLANFGSAENWLQEICDTHNAALAIERKELDHSSSVSQSWFEKHNKLEQQLAAEWEKREQTEQAGHAWKNLSETYLADLKATRQQLLAAQEKIKDMSPENLMNKPDQIDMMSEGELRSELRTVVNQLLNAQAAIAEVCKVSAIAKAMFASLDLSALDNPKAEVRGKGRQEGYSEGWQRAVEELTAERKPLVEFHGDQNLSKEG
jgi:chromosome segregation ATPase